MKLRELFTGAKPSTCKKYKGQPHKLGKSALDSCKSQGIIKRSGKRKHRVGKKVIKVSGTHLKGEKYGGELPDYNKKA